MIAESNSDTWSEFREYDSKKYGAELNEDLVMMIESLIKHWRDRKYGREKAYSRSPRGRALVANAPPHAPRYLYYFVCGGRSAAVQRVAAERLTVSPQRDRLA